MATITIEQKLQAPFPASDIEWRAQQAGITSGKPWAMVLAYVTNRAIQNRLDDVFGADKWQNNIREWRDKSTICGISVKCGDEWITKWDGAAETDIEATKGGISDAMKRAAVQWGIGRYLYKLDTTWAECSLAKQSGPEWHTAKDKSGTFFYWKTPNLPAWALPAGEKPAKSKPQPHAQQPAPATAPAPAQPQVSDRAKAMLNFMESLGVKREDIESAVGVPVSNFTDKDIDEMGECAIRLKENPDADFFDVWTGMKGA